MNSPCLGERRPSSQPSLRPSPRAGESNPDAEPVDNRGVPKISTFRVTRSTIKLPHRFRIARVEPRPLSGKMLQLVSMTMAADELSGTNRAAGRRKSDLRERRARSWQCAYLFRSPTLHRSSQPALSSRSGEIVFTAVCAILGCTGRSSVSLLPIRTS